MPEQFAFNQGGHQRSAVDGNEWFVAKRAGGVNGLGDHFFPGAALAQNQHGMRALSCLGDDPVKLLHLGRVPDDVGEPLARPDSLAAQPTLGLEPQMSADPFEQQTQFFHAERLGDVVVGAILHGLHRRLHRSVASHRDDHRIRTMPLDGLQRFHSACARQSQIEQDRVDAMAVEDAIGLFGRFGDMGAEAQ